MSTIDNPMQPEFQLPATQQPVQLPQAAAQPQAPQAPQPPQPTLREYAVGAQQVARNLERQTSAYTHFKTILETIDMLAAHPERVLSASTKLPFVLVRFPLEEGAPGEINLDLNTLDSETVVTFRPLFERLTTEAGSALLTAWEQFNQISNATIPLVEASRKAMGS